MIILTRVKVNLVNLICSAKKNDGQSEAMSETGLVINTTAGSFIPLRKIRDQKSRAPDLRNDFIVDFSNEIATIQS